MPLKLKVAGKTDVGLVRPGNEDCLHLDHDNHVYAVFDGMGGHQAGEVASQSASDTLRIAFSQFRHELLSDPALALGQSVPEGGELLVKGIRLASREIFNRSSGNSALAGMGTTVVALSFEGDIMSVAHVGDSRCYRLEDHSVTPLTVDHSWVSELQEKQNLSPEDAVSIVGKNVITRALGVRDSVEVDLRLIKVKGGDVFVLCSDGLCGFATDEEIYEAAAEGGGDLERVVGNLVQLANDHGGSDNVTVVVASVESVGASAFEAADKVTFAAEPPELLQAEDQWLETIKMHRRAAETDPPPESKKANKLLLGLIFALFLLVAAVIVYFSTGPDYQP